jgi:hypothetical protein
MFPVNGFVPTCEASSQKLPLVGIDTVVPHLNQCLRGMLENVR